MNANETANQISATKNEAAMRLLSFPSIAERITLAGGGQVESLGPRYGGVPPTVPPASQPRRGSIFAITSGAPCAGRSTRIRRSGSFRRGSSTVEHSSCAGLAQRKVVGSNPSPATINSICGWNRGRTPYRSPVSAQYPAATRGFFESHVVRGYTLNAPRRGRSSIPAPVCFELYQAVAA